jgi:hypothetical protein
MPKYASLGLNGTSDSIVRNTSIDHDDDDDDNDVNDTRTILTTTSNSRNRPAASSSSLSLLSEPLTSNKDDPFYMFQTQLRKQLESVDESLAELLRLVDQNAVGFV